MPQIKKDALRVIDVNLNRTREGLRVCEEIARFVIGNGSLTKDLKNTRHGIHNIYKSFPGGWKSIVVARDTKSDVGKGYSPLEMKRASTSEVFFANMQRSKESIRVLEEFLKLADHNLSNRFKKLRFALYEIERKATARL